MTEEEITKALEGYRHEIASLKHRMDDMERGRRSRPGTGNGQADGGNKAYERIHQTVKRGCSSVKGKACKTLGYID